jgi:hypothetical protein
MGLPRPFRLHVVSTRRVRTRNDDKHKYRGLTSCGSEPRHRDGGANRK